MNLRNFLKRETCDVASFIDVGKLLERIAPENLKVFFPSINFKQIKSFTRIVSWTVIYY